MLPKRPSRFRRLLSWCRRHPLLTTVIVVVMLIMGACTNAVTASQQQQATVQSTPIVDDQATQASAQLTADAATQQTDQPSVQPTDQPTTQPTSQPTMQPTHQATPVPTSKPTQPPRPTPTHPSCSNPWCYDFNPGSLIYPPPSNFCDYFNCIASFWGADDPGDGYVVQCVDGTFSQSGGERGACSSHGGESKPLYAHP